MVVRASRLIFWAPRILVMLLIAFISLFALDVFSEGAGLWKSLLALWMHLIPSFILIAALLISWRKEWIGGILFLALGVAFLAVFGKKSQWIVYGLMSAPLFLSGVLFWIGWFAKKTASRNS